MGAVSSSLLHPFFRSNNLFTQQRDRKVVYLAFPNILYLWCSSCVFYCRLPLSIPKKMLDKKLLDDIAQGRKGDKLE